VRVRLKDTNSRRKVLSDGTLVTYWYAWKGGPRLQGEPGTSDFVASYHEAVSQRKALPSGVMLSILQGSQASAEFIGLAERTRLDYSRFIKIIETEFGTFPLSALADRRTRGEFMAWRDRLASRSRRQADYGWVVLARVLSWALNRGLVAANPCERGGRLYRGSRRDKVWTLDDELAFLERAPRHLHLALQFALWTGQRQGDLNSQPDRFAAGRKGLLLRQRTFIWNVMQRYDGFSRLFHAPEDVSNCWRADHHRPCGGYGCRALIADVFRPTTAIDALRPGKAQSWTRRVRCRPQRPRSAGFGKRSGQD
jgi:hypothetical protein